ncbi:ras-related and estrogen-regulated growth inhibitor-like [Eriocheir sinensis]|uniref:ras-related and estrogen-regulated growth inhibitor-like n=1 Tax=Eriocheir sinensis TaxID=95602 RepID=UPI0021C591C1|nr:ras-related and estrogen-regulated growth inhibitor-like [Eriocheir sinensis]XP_050735593.1 ras-related and estrogen-regulated growth inhibitor-like [Eriocheir sinensis]XP_050735594.1 ras-related and estrogen-regulated growth inhibitor-like [Eriocheir sinensis]XP_050735595.1 ras-related and estrogen-regulated growth inhibitor-like [Eriocheir sinensis]XP_050735597.1 ras-related and estrogen-regulated growth inhibitor-like [Eriocheir sinensis]
MSGRGSSGGMFTPPTPHRSRSAISTPPARKKEERRGRRTTISSTPSPPPSITSQTTNTTTNTTTTTTTPSIIVSAPTITTTPSIIVSAPTITTTSTSTSPPTTATTTITITITTTASPSPSPTTVSTSSSKGHTSSSHQLSPWPGPASLSPSGGGKKNCSSNDSRLVVLGYPAVGKSALVVRFLTGRFIWEYDPTLEAAYRHHTVVDDEVAVMDILDTAGQADGALREGLARWGEGFLLVFSVTDRASFSFLQPLHAALATARTTPNFPCVIVANKTDLGHITSVTEAEAECLASELGTSLFFTSASDGGPSIQAAFSELHRDVVRRRWTRRRRSSAKTVIEGFYKMFTR